MTRQPVRVGVVGTGALGYHHARLLRAVEGAALVGIFDINPTRAAQVAGELETVAFPSLTALVEAVEAVSVAVPTPAHTAVGLEILARGRHALIEKPLADSLEGAEALVAKAADAGALLQVGHVERFNRAVRAAAAYLDEPRFFQTERLAPFQPRGPALEIIPHAVAAEDDGPERRASAPAPGPSAEKAAQGEASAISGFTRWSKRYARFDCIKRCCNPCPFICSL